MNKIIIAILLYMSAASGMDSNQLITLLGNNGYELKMNFQVAQSIPLLNKINLLEGIVLANVTQELLAFLGIYAPIRHELRQKKLDKGVENALEERIKKFSLDELALHTVCIGTMYDEVLPLGFVNAWLEKLNVEKVLIETVDSLMDRQRVDKIYEVCCQDQNASFDYSKIVKKVQENLDEQSKKDKDDLKKTISNCWSDYICRKMTYENFCVVIMGISLICYLCGQKPEVLKYRH